MFVQEINSFLINFPLSKLPSFSGYTHTQTHRWGRATELREERESGREGEREREREVF